MQALIDFGFGEMSVSLEDPINVDIWYSNIYELKESRMDFASLAKM